MMQELKKHAAVTRLQRLADDLRMAYPRVEKRVGEALKEVNAVIAEIGETWKPIHYAENLIKGGAARRPPGCFGHDTFVNGDEADYALFAGRGGGGNCGLYVSICKYHISQPKRASGSPEITVKNKLLVSVEDLPVPLRVRILDVLEDFAEAYEEHVRDVRKGLLTDSGEDAPVEDTVASQRKTGPKTKSSKATAAQPAKAVEPDEGVEVAELVEIDAEAETVKTERKEETLVSSPDEGIPAKLWIPTRI